MSNNSWVGKWECCWSKDTDSPNGLRKITQVLAYLRTEKLFLQTLNPLDDTFLS